MFLDFENMGVREFRPLFTPCCICAIVNKLNVESVFKRCFDVVKQLKVLVKRICLTWFLNILAYFKRICRFA
jgi:hypothetical protein